MTGAWKVRLVATSQRDYLEVIQRSAQDFGPLQAQAYAQTLASTLDALREDGPLTIGVKAREEIGAGIFTLHAARFKRKASHFVVFRVPDAQTIEVLRILHDRIDLARHIFRDQ